MKKSGLKELYTSNLQVKKVLYIFMHTLFAVVQEKFAGAKPVKFPPKLEGFVVTPEQYHQVAQHLKEKEGYAFLSCLTAIDWPKDASIDLIVHLENPETHHCLQLAIPLSRENPQVASLTDLWHGADFLERETFDMFGIQFQGHKNLTRILSPEDEKAFPLRKDFGTNLNDSYGEGCIKLATEPLQLL